MWLQNFLGSATDNYYKWTNLPGMLVSKYEHTIADISGEVQRIAAHLGIQYSEQKSRKLAEDYTLERQKERISNSSKMSNLQQHNKILFDSQELLHTNHILSGKEKRWKTELKPWQIALIENKTRVWLIKNGYELSNVNLSIIDNIKIKFMETLSHAVKAIYYQKDHE